MRRSGWIWARKEGKGLPGQQRRQWLGARGRGHVGGRGRVGDHGGAEGRVGEDAAEQGA